jgi:hypothetical protein
MRRLVALGLSAAALAFPVAGAASANTTCEPVGNLTGVCVEFTCNDHHCIGKTFTAVYTTCRHPFFVLCQRVDLPGPR